MANRGKDFESVIKDAFCKLNNVSVYRLQDSMGGYKGIANICDFIVYKYPHQYFIECKSHKGNTFPLTCITDNQYTGMLEMSKIDGVKAGILLWFIDHDRTIYIPIECIEEYKDSGLKSVNVKDTDYRWTEIQGRKKRIYFEYDMSSLI